MSRSAKPPKTVLAIERKSRSIKGSPAHDLEQRLAEALKREAQALKQLQTRNEEVLDAHAKLKATGEILRVISSTQADLQTVLDAIAASAARLCNSVDALIFQIDGDLLSLSAAYGSLPKESYGATRPITRDVVNGRAVVDRRTIHVHDLAAETHAEFTDAKIYQQSFGHRTIVSTPLLREGTPIGVITIRRMEVHPFSDAQIALLETFADQAVIAIENARLFEEVKLKTKELAALNSTLEARVQAQVNELDRMGRLRRFLPRELAELIVSSGNESILDSHRREITVVFCDLRGFTAFSEVAEPEEVMDVLAEYHKIAGPLIERHEGTLERFLGDGLMVLFNDPVEHPDHVQRALRLGVELRERMSALCKKWQSAGHQLGFGVGIANGFATIGQIGFENRLDYTAIGTVVNQAARLCDEAKANEILITQRVAGSASELIEGEQLGELNLKGLRQPVACWRLLGVKQ